MYFFYTCTTIYVGCTSPFTNQPSSTPPQHITYYYYTHHTAKRRLSLSLSPLHKKEASRPLIQLKLKKVSLLQHHFPHRCSLTLPSYDYQQPPREASTLYSHPTTNLLLLQHTKLCNKIAGSKHFSNRKHDHHNIIAKVTTTHHNIV